MTLKARVKQLEEEQEAREAHERERCICGLVIIEGGEASPEQKAIIARNATCRAHARVLAPPVSVVEVPAPPSGLKAGEQPPPREIED